MTPGEAADTIKPQKVSALVLAARRPGVAEPLATMHGVTHKCMIPVNGQIMLERVVSALLDSGYCRHVYVCIDDPEVLQGGSRLQTWRETGVLSALPAFGNMADSVLTGAEKIPADHWPLLITTGDNALHTPDIIRDFVEGAAAEGAGAALGITREEDVTAQIPDSGLHWHHLRDGGFSSCNLYLLNTPDTLRAVEIFRSGGQFGKKHWRILKTFGLWSFLLYKFKLTTIAVTVRRIGRPFGLRVVPVFLPYAWGPIDVDNATSLALTEHLLKEREADGGKETMPQA